jgi:hypothetical protein
VRTRWVIDGDEVGSHRGRNHRPQRRDVQLARPKLSAQTREPRFEASPYGGVEIVALGP